MSNIPIGRPRFPFEQGPRARDPSQQEQQEWLHRQFRLIEQSLNQVDQLDVLEGPPSDSESQIGMMRYFEDNSQGFGPGPYVYRCAPDGLGGEICGWSPMFADTLVWDDLRAPATAINPPGLASDPTFNTTEGYWEFADAQTELLFITLQIPHGYVEGSNLSPHVHWVQTASGSPLWRMSYKWYNNGEAYPASFTDLDSDAEGWVYTSGNLAQMSTFPDIDGTGMKISSMLQLKLQRIGGDAADTLNGATAKLTEFDIHFLSNSRGSTEEGTKYTP